MKKRINLLNIYDFITLWVEKAEMIITEDKENKLTVEETSEMAGYHSKNAFNNAFKKLSGKTPSEFRKSI